MSARLTSRRAEIPRPVGARAGRALAALSGAIGLAFCLGCVTVVEGGRGPDPSYGGCHVPPGHLPPPGECRVWHPGLPPGQQPPPGDCHELAYDVPYGACLVSGD
ncbi:MAG: hypothetical protein ABFS41_00095 [Myxococcota bacterium]